VDDRVKNNLMVKSLEEGLSNIHGKSKVVKQLIREPFAGSSSFATERIRALLDDNELVDIFFKDLDPNNQLDEAQRIRDIGLERSRREFLMYQKILPPLQIGTPKLYGYRWEPSEDIFWIFLEDAGPKRLSRLGDFSLWVDATSWAARLHSVDLSQLINNAGFLPHYDAEHFNVCARRIEESYSKFDAQQQTTISQALDRYYKIVDYLISLPSCLIHGEYFGKNVMIRPGETNETIAVIDWETAAFGPRCVDLVSITAGRWTPEQRGIMCKAYAEQYQIETGQPIDMVALAQEMENVALYRALWWLGYWSKGDEAHINRWFKELQAVM
jgi:aminoglycoside/choline kinase family phosphotransferase